MTKLIEWISTVVVLFSIWLAIVNKYVQSAYLDKWMYLIFPSPFIFLGIFGVCSAMFIFYKVFTLNDCEYAAKELQDQIVEAKEDLKQKGFVF